MVVDIAAPTYNINDFFDNGHYYYITHIPEYHYDVNGNLVCDLNKGIISITYNELNLPETIDFSGNSRIQYDYDALGTKRRQTTTESGKKVKTIDFIGNFVYENDYPAYHNFDEGRIVYKPDSSCFVETYLKDHLGNVRVAYGDEMPASIYSNFGIRQVNAYYPFGMNINALSENRISKYKHNEYLYNGKMFQDELGLDWLDYGARFYDPVIGRFRSQDRFAEKYMDFTPYQYGANNPILFIDVNGDSLWISYKNEQVLYENGNLYNQNGSAYSGKGMKVKKDGTIKYKGFLGKSYNALNNIDGGREGTSMLQEIEGSTKNVIISKNIGEGNKYLPGANVVNFDPTSKNGGLNTRGSTDRPTFIGLGHELAHSLDDIRGTISLNMIPGQTFTYSEHFATDMENKMRAEQGLPLRTHYGIRNGVGVYPLIDASGNSLYGGGHNYYEGSKLSPIRAIIPIIKVIPNINLR